MKIVTHPSGTSSRFFRNLTYQNIRKLIWGETAAAPLVGVVVSGAILAGFLKHLGISDNVTAVLIQC